MTLAQGSKLGPYEIAAPLGAGGMGEVYRARDTRLKREVAIKVLRAATAKDATALARFQREAEAVAALSHPNILAVHDVGREGNVSFLVTELLEGETLRARIERAAIPWRRCVELAVAVADGIAAAHSRGIVHRDLKPENVFLTEEGVVKVLDFGLAAVKQSVEEQDRTVTLDTKPGTVLGTVCYMSPEQVRGQAVDGRTDVFAFGCTLYEMLTGTRAFKGATSADITTAVLTCEPPGVTESVPEVPAELGRIIVRCLEKKPRRRFQTFDDLAFTLRNMLASSGASRVVGPSLGSSSSSSGGPSIAVLPFENMSADPENEYFSDGVSEEIINALAKVDGLRVAARTSAFSFKGKQVEVAEIGRKLNVGTVLEGSVRKSGDRVRIMAQLVNVTDGYHLWSERFDRKLEDVFAVQDEIARAIVDELKVKLGTDAEAALVQRKTENIEAYNLYLKGRYEWSKMTPQGMKAARDCYERAIELDPHYAAPHAGIACMYVVAAYWGGIPVAEAFPKACEAAKAALAIDESEAEALGALATAHAFFDLDWAAADAQFKRALELDPKNAYTYTFYGAYLTVARRDAESVTAHRFAHELDPLSNFVGSHFGQALNVAGRPDEAVDVLLESIERDPADYFPRYVLGCTYREQLRFAESIDEMRRAVDLSHHDPWITTQSALTSYRFGDRDEAHRLFGRVRDALKHRTVWPLCFVMIHLIQNELDEAVRRLEESRDTHDPGFPWFNVTRRTAKTLNLPSDPRIDAIMAGAGIP